MNKDITACMIIKGLFGSILIDYYEADNFIESIKEAKREIERGSEWLVQKEVPNNGILRIQRNCN